MQLRRFWILVVLCNLSLIPFYSNAQKKYALIFAIGNYPPKGGWLAISGINDIPYITNVLHKQDFPKANIRVLQDSSVTPTGIAKAFKNLDKEVQPGDIVFIYFSTHGEQLTDDNGDEIDDLDESIVTFNAIAPDPFGNSINFDSTQKEYVRDDQLGLYLNSLRARLGKLGDVVVFMDLCYSGSGTRGTGKVRGDKPPLLSPGTKKNELKVRQGLGIFSENENLYKKADSNLAHFTIISAARAEERDVETLDDNNKEIGSLTYAFAKTFEKLPAKISYRSLFANIESVMSQKVPGQHPVIEGNELERELFGGDFIHQKPYIEIDSIGEKSIILKAGKLFGLDLGAKISVYNANISDPSKFVALDSGTVTSADIFSSTVALKNGIKVKHPAIAWAFLSTASYRIKPICISFIAKETSGTLASDGFTMEEIKNIKEKIKLLPLFQLCGKPELQFYKGENEDSIKVSSNGYLFSTVKKEKDNPDDLLEKLQNYAQYKYLHDLQIEDPTIKVELKLVPINNGKPDMESIHKDTDIISIFRENDEFLLFMKNNGPKAVYFNVLDLQPDGVINAVLPNTRMTNPIYPEDLRIESGASYLFHNYKITVSPPFGRETFKVFVTTDMINLESIATSKGVESRGNFLVLEKLLRIAFSIAKRSAPEDQIGHANGTIFNIPFFINPKLK